MKILGVYSPTGALIPYDTPQRVQKVGDLLIDSEGQVVAVMDPYEGWLLQANLRHGIHTKVKVQTIITL